LSWSPGILISVGADDSPAYQRRTLGRRLRRLRTAARLSFAEAVERLELSDTTLNRIERGTTGVGIHTVKSMLDLYGVGADEWEPVLDLVREANKRGWWAEYGLTNKSYPALETAASVVWEFASSYIPGLLQTEGYMEAVFRSSVDVRTGKQFQNQVEIRKIRQRRLVSAEDPLELFALIDEGVLRRPIAQPEQLAHLLRMTEHPTVSIQVLPTGVGAHIGMRGSFSILTFPDPQEPEVGYCEHAMGAMFLNRASDVRVCKSSFEHLRSLALGSEESKALIRRM
jgi:transcriptional regulator with XRE-family HTH domain